MLVLSRKKNESIIINDDITLTVVEIRGDKVRRFIRLILPGLVPNRFVHLCGAPRSTHLPAARRGPKCG